MTPLKNEIELWNRGRLRQAQRAGLGGRGAIGGDADRGTVRHRAIEGLDPADKLRRWGADCNEGRDQRGMEVEQTWGDKCGFKRRYGTMVVTTEGARMVIGRVVGAMPVNNRLTGV